MMLLPLRYVDLLILASKWLLLIQVDLVVKKVFGPNFDNEQYQHEAMSDNVVGAMLVRAEL